MPREASTEPTSAGEIEMDDVERVGIASRGFFPENVWIAYATRGLPVREPMSGLHPLVRGLFQELPPPETHWTGEARVRWLNTAAHIFALLYMTGGSEARIIAELICADHGHDVAGEPA